MSKSLLIIVKIAPKGSSGIGGLIVLGLLIYFFASNLLAPKQNLAAIPNGGRTAQVTHDSKSNSVHTLYTFTGRYYNVNLPDSDSDSLWWSNSLEGAIVGRYWSGNLDSVYMVFTQNGLELTTSANSGTAYDARNEAWPTTLLSNLNNTGATDWVNSDVYADGGNGSYRITIFEQDGSSRCYIKSPNLFKLDSGLEFIGQVGYFATYNRSSVQLWDNHCNEILRYSAEGSIRAVIATSRSGLLFVEQINNGNRKSSEYFVRFLGN